MIPGFVCQRVVASFLQGSAMRDESEFILGKKSCSMVEGADRGRWEMMGVGKSKKKKANLSATVELFLGVLFLLGDDYRRL